MLALCHMHTEYALGWLCNLSWEGVFNCRLLYSISMLYPVKLLIISYDSRIELWNIFMMLSREYQFISIQYQGIACVDCRKMICISRSSLKNTRMLTLSLVRYDNDKMLFQEAKCDKWALLFKNPVKWEEIWDDTKLILLCCVFCIYFDIVTT